MSEQAILVFLNIDKTLYFIRRGRRKRYFCILKQGKDQVNQLVETLKKILSFVWRWVISAMIGTIPKLRLP